jgi:hypothetical protein
MRKVRVFDKTAIAVAVSTIFLLSACGGGGGGGGGSSGSPYSPGNPYLRTEVPYSTPVRVGTVDPLVNTKYTHFVGDTYVANISGSGEDVIVAGASTQSSASDWASTRLSMFSWQNGTLVDKTSQWFVGDSNIILGTNAVKFADFFNTGRTGMVTAPYSDWSLADNGPAYVWTNNGSSFTRQAIAADVSAHDFAVADINGDGFKDIVILDANARNSTLAINDRVSSFTSYRATTGTQLSGSGIAVADFLNNGSSTFITTDNWSASGQVQKLWSWAIDGGNNLSFNELAVLPTSRFNLPKWQAIGILDSHNVRVAAHDFNSDSVMDAIVFSQPGRVQAGTSTNYSEIQFLKNNGSGSFTDVTDSTLVGYDTNTRTTYQPKFLDLNGDGLTDILVSGGDNSGTSSQFLLKSADGKYVATYAKVLSDYLAQVKTMAGGDANDHTVNVVKGPDGKMYLVSAVSHMNGSDRQLAVYISALGSQSVTTAQTAVNLMLQKWPYMTAAAANDALSRTVATYMNGVGIIDEDAIFKPIGSLGLPTAGGFKAINGFIAGVNLGDGSVVAMDMAGRSYNMNLTSMAVSRMNAFGYNTQHNDQYELTSHAEYLVNGQLTTVNGMRIGADYAGRDANNMSALNKPTQYTLGVPKIYSYGKWRMGTQYTYLNSNPWIAFGGAWGEVTGSGIMDNVVTYRNRGFSAQASLMHVSTNITPGLITKVNNMWGAWAETGYRFGSARENGDMGIYAGIKPVVLSGSVEASMPTSVDNSGNIVYTNKKLAVQNQTTGYIRALYTNQLNRQTQLRLSAVSTTTGQYRAMTEIRFWID